MTHLDSAHLDRSRITDQVYEAVRKAIFRRDIQPGDRLSVPLLATQLNVSRSPVREAVLRLVKDGLAIEEPRKGVVVLDLDSDQLLAIYEVREVLEALAARLAAARVTDDALEALAACLQRHEKASLQGDTEQALSADMEFHQLVREATGNDQLVGFLNQLKDKVRMAMRTTSVTQGIDRALADHKQIFAALMAHDADAAADAAAGHVARLREALASEIVDPAGRRPPGREHGQGRS